MWIEDYGLDLSSKRDLEDSESTPQKVSKSIECINNFEITSTFASKVKVEGHIIPDECVVDQQLIHHRSDISRANLNSATIAPTSPIVPIIEKSETEKWTLSTYNSPLKFTTPKRSSHLIDSTRSTSTKGMKTPKLIVDDSKSERVLKMDKIFNYGGGPLAFLYGGKMAVYVSGKIIVLLNITDNTGLNFKDGFWKAFRSEMLQESSQLSPIPGSLDFMLLSA